MNRDSKHKPNHLIIPDDYINFFCIFMPAVFLNELLHVFSNLQHFSLPQRISSSSNFDFNVYKCSAYYRHDLCKYSIFCLVSGIFRFIFTLRFVGTVNNWADSLFSLITTIEVRLNVKDPMYLIFIFYNSFSFMLILCFQCFLFPYSVRPFFVSTKATFIFSRFCLHYCLHNLNAGGNRAHLKFQSDFVERFQEQAALFQSHQMHSITFFGCRPSCAMVNGVSFCSPPLTFLLHIFVNKTFFIVCHCSFKNGVVFVV